MICAAQPPGRRLRPRTPDSATVEVAATEDAAVAVGTGADERESPQAPEPLKSWLRVHRHSLHSVHGRLARTAYDLMPQETPWPRTGVRR